MYIATSRTCMLRIHRANISFSSTMEFYYIPSLLAMLRFGGRLHCRRKCVAVAGHTQPKHLDVNEP